MEKNKDVGDITQLYFNELEEFSLLSNDEVIQLKEAYQNGNLQAKNQIVEGNLRLVRSIALKYIHKTTSFTLLDLIQEGNIGLMRAVETYNEKRGSFSNYATVWIHSAIKKGINLTDKMISIPHNISLIKKEYIKLVSEYYDKYGVSPSDLYIQNKLRIKKETLHYLKHEKDFDFLSLNQTIGNEDSPVEIGDLFPSMDNYNDVIKRMDNYDFLNVIKNLLTDEEYYILYYRVLSNNKKTLEKIGKEIGINKETVRQKEKRILKKIKHYVEPNRSEYQKCLERLKQDHGKFYNKMKITPLEVDNIYIFLYVMEKLSMFQRKMLYLQIIDNYQYTLEDLSKVLNVTRKELQKENENLQKILKTELSNGQDFLIFKEECTQKKDFNVFKIDLIDFDSSGLGILENQKNKIKKLA